MKKYVLLLGRCLGAYRHSHRFILYFDVHRAHLHPAVLRALARLDIWVCAILGKMTSSESSRELERVPESSEERKRAPGSSRELPRDPDEFQRALESSRELQTAPKIDFLF